MSVRSIVVSRALYTNFEEGGCLTYIGREGSFAAGNVEALLDKIALRRNFSLNGDEEVAQGIVAPQDFVNGAAQAELGARFRVGQGIFVLSDQERRSLHLTKEERGLVKPYYTTEELGCYFGNPKNKYWIIYTDSGSVAHVRWHPIQICGGTLISSKDVITSHNHPYGLHRARDEKFFVGEKIVSLRKCA